MMSAASSRSSSIASAALYMVAQPQGLPAHGYAPTPCNREAASRGRAGAHKYVRQRDVRNVRDGYLTSMHLIPHYTAYLQACKRNLPYCNSCEAALVQQLHPICFQYSTKSCLVIRTLCFGGAVLRLHKDVFLLFG